MNDTISIRNLVVRFHTYEGIVEAVNHLNLDIKHRETLGLVGETGCGKTMTALSILRLIQEPGKIEEGSILFNIDGDKPIDLLKITEAQMRTIRGSHISMVFQEPGAALNPVYTIGEQIAESILLHKKRTVTDNAARAAERHLAEGKGLPAALRRPFNRAQVNLYRQMRDDDRAMWPRIVSHTPIMRRLLWRIQDEAWKIAASLLKDVEIPDPERILKMYPYQLSGGMKQRAVIAMALACCPRLLIADEPTTSLDVTIQAQILQLIYKLKEEFGTSVLYITHDLAVAAEICDRIGVMYAGSMCEIASAQDIFAHPSHPYTRALMAAVPKPGTEPHAIGGSVPDPLSPPSGCRFHPRCPRADERCRQKTPELAEVEPGHFVACYYSPGDKIGNTD